MPVGQQIANVKALKNPPKQKPPVENYLIWYMPRINLENEQQGAGIYAEKQQKRDIVETLAYQKESSEYECLTDDFIGHQNSCQFDDSDSQIDIGHLNATQQVLDVLDQQIRTLNEVKHTATNQSHCCSDKSKNNSSTTSDDHHIQIPSIKQQTNYFETENSTNESRKFLLNHYIRQSIDETGKCGCHYEHDFGNSRFVGKLTDQLDDKPLESECGFGSEYLIEESNSKRDSAQSNGPVESDDENHNSVNVCLELAEKTDDCCADTSVIGHRLLIGHKPGCCAKKDCLTGSVVASEIERDSDPASAVRIGKPSLQRQALTDSFRVEHEFCKDSYSGIHGQKDSILLHNNQQHFTHDYHNYLEALETFGDSANSVGSFILADEYFIIDSQVDDPVSERSLPTPCQPSDGGLEDEDRESCESELGNALEGLVDSFDGEPSPIPSPLLDQTSQRESTEHILDFEHQTSCIRQQRQDPLVFGLPDDPNLSLSWFQELPQTNYNNNKTVTNDKQNSDYISTDLRRQLYFELNARFQGRAASVEPPENNSTPEELRKNFDERSLFERGNTTNWDRGPRSAPFESSSLSLNEAEYTRRKRRRSKHNSKIRQDADLARVGSCCSRSSNYSATTTNASRVGKFNAYATSSSTSTSELNYRVAQELRGKGDSMKAVKDIAKISVPSLSSLQYLPNQIESPNKLKLSKRKSINNSISNNSNMEANIQKSGQTTRPMSSVKVIAESREDIQHESGLLHNLCLCNCMARSSQDAQRVAQSNSDAEEKDDKSSSLRANSPKSKKSSSKRSVRSSKSSRASESPSNEEGAAELSPVGKLDLEKQNKLYEKQSPSFLNILKSSAHISHNFRQHLPNSQHGKHHPREGISRGLVGNSVGDLDQATESCCSSGRDSVDTNVISESSSFLRARSTSFANSEQQQHLPSLRASSSASPYNEGLLTPDDSTRAQSACSTRLDGDRIECSKKGVSHKKLSSFFGPPPTGLKQVDVCENRISSPEVSKHSKKNKNISFKQKNPQQQSFFTRSLNRLSNRTKRTSPEKQQLPENRSSSSLASASPSLHDQQTTFRSTCTSPTISISTVSKCHDESITDSVNSLDDEVALPEFSPVSPSIQRIRSSSLLKPEITFNKVNHYTSSKGGSSDNQSLLSSSAASCDMTRTKGYKFHSQREIGGGYNEPVARYGSEMSYYRSESGSERACSLPASPHGLRRDLCAKRNLSPRLTQSPVPFPSPAAESTKIEDGLKVCSTEHFEKHIGNIKGNQIEAQKKLFKAWINHYCPHLIQRDLVEEFKDGIKLIGLLASLTRDKRLLINYEKLVRDKQAYINRLVITPTSRLRHLSNVSIAIDYLRKDMGMKMINLNPMDIVSGKPNVTLGLCWNIILNFQLDQNFLRHLNDYQESISQHSSTDDHASIDCTSRFSDGVTNEDTRARGDTTNNRRLNNTYRTNIIGEIEEYSSSDLVVARKKLLDHINKRFNLKLTNLTSNLLDGDVLSIIIRQLAPQVEHEKRMAGKEWVAMSNDEKLDHCFDLAQKHLEVPRLFSASDLKYQMETDCHSKPLLVYLSMLLKTPDRKDSISRKPTTTELAADGLLEQESESSQVNYSTEARIRDFLNDIDRDDKFEVNRIHSTLTKIKQFKILSDKLDSEQAVSKNLLASCRRLAEEADQIENLISWINQADSLFETKHKSAADLTNAIDEYRKFFSPGNVPQVTITLCPTLERQYRECLSSAKQRVLLMEQTLKNWHSYERARIQLKEWLSTAEIKLANALGPAGDQLDTIEHHTEKLEDLIDYFELEPMDSILMNESTDGPNAGFMNYRLPSLESLPSSLLSMNQSISGSVLSIGSTSSRISTLQSSKKATYNKLFDDFELKCRLLAAHLDSDQRDSLLIGVRELKYRLRYITEQKVPQVVSELKFYISRCEMCIEEELDEQHHDPVVIDIENVAEIKEPNIVKHNYDRTEQVSVELSAENPVVESVRSNKSISQKGCKDTETNMAKADTDTSNNLLDKVNPTVPSKPNDSWSLLGWVLSGKQDDSTEVVSVKRNKAKRKNRASKANNKHRNKNRPKQIVDRSKSQTETDDSDDITYARLFWSKIVRAYRASMPFNIVLLICLAGICIVPMMQKDACCELTGQNNIPSENLNLDPKPT